MDLVVKHIHAFVVMEYSLILDYDQENDYNYGKDT